MKIIDPHIHLFALEQGDYHWLKARNAPFWSDKSVINKSVNEKNLALNAPLFLAAFVHIEAGFDNNAPWRELDYLQTSCQLPYTAIASIDLTLEHTNFIQQIEKLMRYPAFVGVRHILDEQAVALLTNTDVINNIVTLNTISKNRQQSLVIEVQMPFNEDSSLSDTTVSKNSSAVSALCQLIANNKQLTFIINHAGFPDKNLSSTGWQHWQANLVKLARYNNTAIKCSGWEMINRDYLQQEAWLNITLQACFSAFGIQRMMLASNFPLCLFSQNNYMEYWQFMLNTDFIQSKTKQEKSALCYHNALHFYQIKINN